ncbi:Hypothetical predicted protein, partial [Scomber scombrus]
NLPELSSHGDRLICEPTSSNCVPERMKCTWTADVAPMGYMVCTPLSWLLSLLWMSLQSSGRYRWKQQVNTGARRRRKTETSCNRNRAAHTK